MVCVISALQLRQGLTIPVIQFDLCIFGKLLSFKTKLSSSLNYVKRFHALSFDGTIARNAQCPLTILCTTSICQYTPAFSLCLAFVRQDRNTLDPHSRPSHSGKEISSQDPGYMPRAGGIGRSIRPLTLSILTPFSNAVEPHSYFKVTVSLVTHRLYRRCCLLSMVIDDGTRAP